MYVYSGIILSLFSLLVFVLLIKTLKFMYFILHGPDCCFEFIYSILHEPGCCKANTVHPLFLTVLCPLFISFDTV